MALIIVISTEDFQIRCNVHVLSLSFSERESGKWPFGLSDFSLFDYIIVLLVIDCIQHFGEISSCSTYLKQFLYAAT